MVVIEGNFWSSSIELIYALVSSDSNPSSSWVNPLAILNFLIASPNALEASIFSPSKGELFGLG